MRKSLYIFMLFCAYSLSINIKQEKNNFEKPKEGYIRSAGAKIYYKVIGKGDPIIVVHGGPGLNQSYFFPHFNNLAEKHQLIFYDQRGCGKSSDSAITESITLENYIEDIDALRKEFKLEKITLLAHSFGGVFACNYAFTYPERMKKLILINSVPLNKEFEKEIGVLNKQKQLSEDSIARSEIIKSKEFQEGEVLAFEKLFKVVFRASFFDRSYSDSLHLKLENNFGANRKKLSNLAKDLSQFDFYESLKKVKCPVIVIYGKNDAIPFQAYAKMKDNLKDCEIIGIDKCGHYPFIEQKTVFFSMLNTKLAKSKIGHNH